MKRKVEIKTNYGVQVLEAAVIKGMAVHRPLMGGGWTVTHVTSGMSLYHPFGTKRQAREFARLIAAKYDTLADEVGLLNDIRAKGGAREVVAIGKMVEGKG
jgi:hypothetical protein